MFRVPFLATLLFIARALPLASQDAGGWTVEVKALPAPEHERIGRDFNPEAKAPYDAGMAEDAVRETAIKAEVKSTLDAVYAWSRGAGFPPLTPRIAWLQSTCNTSPFALSMSNPAVRDPQTAKRKAQFYLGVDLSKPEPFIPTREPRAIGFPTRTRLDRRFAANQGRSSDWPSRFPEPDG